MIVWGASGGWFSPLSQFEFDEAPGDLGRAGPHWLRSLPPASPGACRSPRTSRLILSWVLLSFSPLWAFLLTAGGPRREPTARFSKPGATPSSLSSTFMFGYTLMGLWLGRFYLWLGLTVCSSSWPLFLPGYFVLRTGCRWRRFVHRSGRLCHEVLEITMPASHPIIHSPRACASWRR
jgi:hypothetical protein